MAKYEKQTHDDVSARDDFLGAGLAVVSSPWAILGRCSRLPCGAKPQNARKGTGTYSERKCGHG
jgi:hypothetical protein